MPTIHDNCFVSLYSSQLCCIKSHVLYVLFAEQRHSGNIGHIGHIHHIDSYLVPWALCQTSEANRKESKRFVALIPIHLRFFSSKPIRGFHALSMFESILNVFKSLDTLRAESRRALRHSSTGLAVWLSTVSVLSHWVSPDFASIALKSTLELNVFQNARP